MKATVLNLIPKNSMNHPIFDLIKVGEGVCAASVGVKSNNTTVVHVTASGQFTDLPKAGFYTRINGVLVQDKETTESEYQVNKPVFAGEADKILYKGSADILLEASRFCTDDTLRDSLWNINIERHGGDSVTVTGTDAYGLICFNPTDSEAYLSANPNGKILSTLLKPFKGMEVELFTGGGEHYGDECYFDLRVSLPFGNVSYKWEQAYVKFPQYRNVIPRIENQTYSLPMSAMPDEKQTKESLKIQSANIQVNGCCGETPCVYILTEEKHLINLKLWEKFVKNSPQNSDLHFSAPNKAFTLYEKRCGVDCLLLVMPIKEFEQAPCAPWEVPANVIKTVKPEPVLA